MSWPRGLKHRLVRIQSKRAMKSWRRSAMLAPFSKGAPPATSRTGLPAVWPSMQKKIWRMRRRRSGGVGERKARPRRGGRLDHRDHLRAPRATERQARHPHPLGTAPHDLLGELDRLDE